MVVLRDWGLSAGKATCVEEAVEEIESAFATAKEVVEGTSAGALRSEFNELNNRIRTIEQRLQEIEEELREVENLVVAEAKVVATTLTRAYKRESVQKRRFNTVILDEASMAPIPALWVAAALADANVVVVGDFRQLPPIVQAETDVAKKWLGRDVFEASGVQEAYETHLPPHYFIALQEQFRMHPAISAIPNHFLYRDELRDADGLDSDGDGMAEWFEADWGYDSPVLLVDTGSLNAWVTSVNNGRHSSRLNFLSATVCVDLAAMLLRQGRPEQQGGRARVLIGAPYRPHAKLLNLLIRENKLDRDVRAGTAHTFQGSEAPVMIFDLVNDEPHWKVGMFMASRNEDFKRLLNVALTRAQRRLILVGDFDYIAKQGKKAFVRELIDFMRERYPRVEAGAIIPSGLSARAARMQLAVQASAGPDALPHLVVTQDAFYSHLFRDLAAAEKRIVIYSAFLTQNRLGAVQPQLKAAVERGASVWVVTKELEDRGKQRPHYKRLEEALREWGVQIAHKSRMHEKLVFVDDDVVWHGSLNALSFTDTQEIMARYDNRAVAEYFAKTVCMEELLEAYSNGLAGERKCPFCLTGEVIATEGKGEPFYWRCVNDDCFKRGIGDPMPKDGMVVCASSGCGAPVHFGSWGDEPHWRCDKNPHHRMRIAASHLRLPKMRGLIPARELKKLEKRIEEARAKRGQARPGRGSERAGQLPLL